MVPKQRRFTQGIGAVTADWSGSLVDARTGRPAIGGCGWVRLQQVAEYSSHAWSIGPIAPSHSRIGVDHFNGGATFDHRFVVMQRYMDTGTSRQIATARAAGQIVINDLDDWYWGLHADNAAKDATDPALSPHSNIDHYRAALLASSLVVVSTPFLAEQVARWGDVPVELIRNGIDVTRFPRRLHMPARPVTIGWTGSVGHRSGDLEILRAPFAKLPDTMHYHHTGHWRAHPSFGEKTGLPEDRYSTLPLLTASEYPHGFVFDIGLVPLADVPFNRAKSWIKGLEYAAAGIPVVASPVGEYVVLAEEHGIGRLAKTTQDWVRELTVLTDYETRVAEADRQREAVRALSAKAQAKAWDRLIWSMV